MKKLFLCHASEDKYVAEPIHLALVNAGFEVFYDEMSLPAGGDYHGRINEAIKQCDLFIFLISKASVEKGKYTLSEMGFARERWPSPVNRVLPVNLEGVPTREIPNYLAATTILTIKGNPAAEVRASIEKLLKEQRRRRTWLPYAVAVLIASIAVVYLIVLPTPHAPVFAKGCGNYRFLVGTEHGGYWTTKWISWRANFLAMGVEGRRNHQISSLAAQIVLLTRSKWIHQMRTIVSTAGKS